ncbi:MAG: secondary thiamine-phosphate synthase enzyme YjbQ [Candidatus Doudnabacteria bacterium]
MANFLKQNQLTTKKQFDFVDITEAVNQSITESGISDGQVLVYSNHTTASIRINHNEPMLIGDIMRVLYTLVPIESNYTHDLVEIRQNVAVDERSNGHAHVKAVLLGASETIPLRDGKLVLGDKQSVFFVELDGGRERDYFISIIG